MPDLILIDGGKGQLSAALAALGTVGVREQPVASLAKRFEEVYVPGHPEPLSIPRTSAALRLLQRMRDESHRFAVTYHRTLRSHRTLTSALDAIPGIGPARRQALLETFGSVEGVRAADLDALAAAPRMNQHLATVVHEHLHVPPAPPRGDRDDAFGSEIT